MAERRPPAKAAKRRRQGRRSLDRGGQAALASTRRHLASRTRIRLAGNPFQHAFPSIVWSILIVSGLAVLYTVLAGLRAVVVTAAIQTVLLLLGAIGILYLIFS